MHHVQPEPGAVANALGREERLEDTRLHFRRNSRPIVRYLDKHVVVFAHDAYGELSFFFHRVGGIVDEVCPDLIKLAAVGHHFRQVRSIFARNDDAALQFVMHDSERGFQAALDVHFLERRLVHVGIFFDRFDQFRNARRALFEFRGDALHFEERAEAREFGPKGSSGGRCKIFQLRVR